MGEARFGEYPARDLLQTVKHMVQEIVTYKKVCDYYNSSLIQLINTTQQKKSQDTSSWFVDLEKSLIVLAKIMMIQQKHIGSLVHELYENKKQGETFAIETEEFTEKLSLLSEVHKKNSVGIKSHLGKEWNQFIAALKQYGYQLLVMGNHFSIVGQIAVTLQCGDQQDNEELTAYGDTLQLIGNAIETHGLLSSKSVLNVSGDITLGDNDAQGVYSTVSKDLNVKLSAELLNSKPTRQIDLVVDMDTLEIKTFPLRGGPKQFVVLWENLEEATNVAYVLSNYYSIYRIGGRGHQPRFDQSTGIYWNFINAAKDYSGAPSDIEKIEAMNAKLAQVNVHPQKSDSDDKRPAVVHKGQDFEKLEQYFFDYLNHWSSKVDEEWPPVSLIHFNDPKSALNALRLAKIHRMNVDINSDLVQLIESSGKFQDELQAILRADDDELITYIKEHYQYQVKGRPETG